MNTGQYSFCETVTATGSSPWHIRKLTKTGQKLGGGADTKSLCGLTVAWDLGVQLSTEHFGHCCNSCVWHYEGGES